MKEHISRREFVKLLLLAAASSACQRLGLPRETQPTQPAIPPTGHDIVTSTPFSPAETPTQTAPASPSASPSAEPTLNPSATPVPEIELIIDGHLDIGWNALEFERDFTQSASSSWEAETQNGLAGLVGKRTVGLPELLTGKIGLVFSSIFVMPARNAYSGWNKVIYWTPEQAQTHAWAQLTYYHDLANRSRNIRLVGTRQDLEAVLYSWQVDQPNADRMLGLVPTMEGAEPIISPKDVERWYQFGLRAIGPAWHRTRYAGGTGEPGPLTELGYQLLNEMNRVNMILDLSHLAERAFFQALEAYPGTVIASHSNPRKYLPTDRGLSDAMIRELAGHNGVMGIALYNRYLSPTWRSGHPKAHVRLALVAEVIDYVVQLLGTTQHVAIGSDFDGGFGSESIPMEIETAADLWQLNGLLLDRGYPQKSVNEILHGNWIRILSSSLP